MFDWLISVLGIFIGNSMWLMGLVVLGMGAAAIRTEKKSILKAVGMMSITTGGKPKGFALRLKEMVEPVDRSNEVGLRLLAAGTALVLIGCSFVSSCAG